MPLVPSMYMYWDVRSKVRVGIGYTEEFVVLVDVQWALPIARYIILLDTVSRARCLGKKRPIDGRMVKKLEVDNKVIEVVPKVCYLVDIFSACCDYDPIAIPGCK